VRSPIFGIATLAAVLSASVVLIAPVSAEPINEPCPLALGFLCQFLPIAPDLEEDVDLTTPQPSFMPVAPSPGHSSTPEGCVEECRAP
jgi:hypothetical protein